MLREAVKMKKKFSCLHRTLPDILHCTQLAATLHIKGTEKEVECSLAEVRPESAVKGMELSVPYGHFSGDGVSLLDRSLCRYSSVDRY